jgi:hypothetical protein
MLVRSSVLLVVGLLASCATAVAAGPSASPAEVVSALYGHHLAHDMAFTPAGIAERSRWLTPDLVALCRAYFAKPTSPDEVPDINGDPFTDSQEYPTGFRVGPAERDGDRATVPVILSWPGGATRTVRVRVARSGDTWLVSDVLYESGPSLRQLLGEAR